MTDVATDTVLHHSPRLSLGAASPAELQELVFAMLLVAPGPTTVTELAAGGEIEPADVEAALVALETRSAAGWAIQRHADTVQLVSAPRFAAAVRRFLGLDRETRLSAAALETLAIVAYRQPVTRPEIEAVRGVDCSSVLANLVDRGLVEPVGRLASAGQPIQYGTTPAFLNVFGLSSLADLPALGEVAGASAADRLTSLIAAGDLGPSAPDAATSGPA